MPGVILFAAVNRPAQPVAAVLHCSFIQGFCSRQSNFLLISVSVDIIYEVSSVIRLTAMVYDFLFTHFISFIQLLQVLQYLSMQFPLIPALLPESFPDTLMGKVPSAVISEQEKTFQIPDKQCKVQTAPFHSAYCKYSLQIFLPQSVSGCRYILYCQLRQLSSKLCGRRMYNVHTENSQIIRQAVHDLQLMLCNGADPVALFHNLFKITSVHHYQTLYRQTQVQRVVRALLPRYSLCHRICQLSFRSCQNSFHNCCLILLLQRADRFCLSQFPVISGMESIQKRTYYLHLI